jgi:hypothetical protein
VLPRSNESSLRCQPARGVAGVEGVAWLEQQERRLDLGEGLVGATTRDDMYIARSEDSVAFVHPYGQTSPQDEEELVGFGMPVSGELALNLYDSHVVVVTTAIVLGVQCSPTA